MGQFMLRVISTYHRIKIWLLLRIARTLDFSTFDTSAHHFLGEKLFSSEKKLVIIATSVHASRKTLETIEIQLTLKRGQFSLVEVSYVQMDDELRLVYHLCKNVSGHKNSLTWA